MTKKEFSETSFKKGMKVKYMNLIWDLLAVDFEFEEFTIRNEKNIIEVEIKYCELIKE